VNLIFESVHAQRDTHNKEKGRWIDRRAAGGQHEVGLGHNWAWLADKMPGYVNAWLSAI